MVCQYNCSALSGSKFDPSPPEISAVRNRQVTFESFLIEAYGIVGALKLHAREKCVLFITRSLRKRLYAN